MVVAEMAVVMVVREARKIISHILVTILLKIRQQIRPLFLLSQEAIFGGLDRGLLPSIQLMPTVMKKVIVPVSLV